MYLLSQGDRVVSEYIGKDGARIRATKRVGSSVGGANRKVLVNETWDNGFATNYIYHYSGTDLRKVTGLNRESTNAEYSGVASPGELRVGQVFTYTTGTDEYQITTTNRVLSSRSVTLPDGTKATGYEVESDISTVGRAVSTCVPGYGVLKTTNDTGTWRMVSIHRKR